MAIEMVKLFLSGLSTASDMLSLAIFKGTAMLLVTIFRVIQLPGWTINCVLCLIRESAVTMMETIVDISGKWLVSAVNTGSELVTNATTTAASSLVEVVTVQTESLVNATAEVYQLASETGLSTASVMLSLAIFKGTAMLLVAIFRVIQLPGWAINCVLCLIRESIVTMMETTVDLSDKWLVTAVKTGSELVTNATTIAASSLVEVVTVQTELLVNATQQAYQLASETGVGIASTLWENFREAVDFFIKYAVNN